MNHPNYNIQIASPIWSEKAIGIHTGLQVPEMNFYIDIMYVAKSTGKRSYPYTYLMTKAEIDAAAIRTEKRGGKTIFIVPISSLKLAPDVPKENN